MNSQELFVPAHSCACLLSHYRQLIDTVWKLLSSGYVSLVGCLQSKVFPKAHMNMDITNWTQRNWEGTCWEKDGRRSLKWLVYLWKHINIVQFLYLICDKCPQSYVVVCWIHTCLFLEFFTQPLTVNSFVCIKIQFFCQLVFHVSYLYTCKW